MAHASNDALITDALRSGRLTVDADTGHCWMDGRPVGRPGRDGYVRIRLRSSQVMAHRVAWIAEHGAIGSGLVVNHRNGRRWDNRLVNLETVTRQQNVAHAVRHWSYQGVDPRDVEVVDPAWLARMLETAARGDDPPRSSFVSYPTGIIDRMRLAWDAEHNGDPALRH